MEYAEGHAINKDEMHWRVYCPRCDYEIIYKGFFCSDDECECPKCKLIFGCKRVWIDDDTYIE